MSNSNPPMFTSREEAEQATGRFSVISMKITGTASKRISDYLGRQGLTTYASADNTKRYTAVYTLKFDIKDYAGLDRRSGAGAYAWVRKSCNYGNLKSEIRYSIAMYGGGGLTPTEELHEDHAMRRVRDIRRRTPPIEQLHFWMCRKYPEHLLWVEYTQAPWLLPNSGEPLSLGMSDGDWLVP